MQWKRYAGIGSARAHNNEGRSTLNFGQAAARMRQTIGAARARGRPAGRPAWLCSSG